MKKIYLDEIEEKSNELKNYSTNNIAEKIEEMKKLPSEFIWKGKARDSFIYTYVLKINEIERLNINLSKIAEFLLLVNDNYSNANSRINNAYEELLSEFSKVK